MADEYGRGGYGRSGASAGDDYESGGYNRSSSGGADEYGRRPGGGAGGYNKPGGTDDYDSGYNNRSGANEEYGRNKSGDDEYSGGGGGAEADEEYVDGLSSRDDPEKYRKEEKEHKNKERLGEVGALAAGAFAMVRS